jgi:hypothetical protein
VSRQRGNLQCSHEERVWERRDTRASVGRRVRDERKETYINNRKMNK